MSQRTREALAAYGFLLPFLLTLLAFFLYAFLRTAYFSLTDYDLFRPPNLVGVRNYVDIVTQPLFLTALTNTLLYSFTTTTLQVIGSLLLANVLNQRLRGLPFFRTAYYIPSITSSVVITLIFAWLFQPVGIVSYLGNYVGNRGGYILAFLAITVLVQAVQVFFERRQGLPAGVFDPVLLVTSVLIGLAGTWLLSALGVVTLGNAPQGQFNWLSTRERWLGIIPYPLLVIIIQNTFTTIPTLMLFFLAGLQGVPRGLYEAASIDGATPWEQIRHVTIPMLRPVTFYAITVSLIGTLQLFDQVSLLASVAPQESTISLAFYVYTNVFGGGGVSRVGLASAAALILAALTITIVLIQRRFLVRDEGAA